VAAPLAPAALELLRAPNVAHVVTRRADGRPRVVVTWVHARPDAVLLNARADRAWVADLRREPHATVTVVDLADPHRYVTVEGPVRIAAQGAQEAYRALAARYWGAAGAARHLPAGERVALTVAPARVRLYQAVRPPTG
jgi:PPOX class probable F420-dependent enzyme